MPELVADCPRCGSKRMTFDVTKESAIEKEHDWQSRYEVFSICRHCHKATIFVLRLDKIDHKSIAGRGLANIPGAINRFFRIEGFISLKDTAAAHPPEHLPRDIEAAFKEGATCRAVGCYNAAAAMFRLCIDMATRPLLPKEETRGLNRKTRRDLGLRLPWLFDNHIIPEALRELSHCVKEDGNDGAHAGSLTKADADDLLDFTTVLLERMFTEPERLRLAKERREKRREQPVS